MGADPTRDAQARKLAVSLRLKAGRFLAGRISEDGRAVALSVPELAKDERLRANGITRNRLEDYEQMKVEPRPMELEKIAEALDVPASFLLSGLTTAEGRFPPPGSVEELLDELRRATRHVEQLFGQLGRDVGLRDLQSRPAEDRMGERPTVVA